MRLFSLMFFQKHNLEFRFGWLLDWIQRFQRVSWEYSSINISIQTQTIYHSYYSTNSVHINHSQISDLSSYSWYTSISPISCDLCLTQLCRVEEWTSTLPFSSNRSAFLLGFDDWICKWRSTGSRGRKGTDHAHMMRFIQPTMAFLITLRLEFGLRLISRLGLVELLGPIRVEGSPLGRLSLFSRLFLSSPF